MKIENIQTWVKRIMSNIITAPARHALSSSSVGYVVNCWDSKISKTIAAIDTAPTFILTIQLNESLTYFFFQNFLKIVAQFA